MEKDALQYLVDLKKEAEVIDDRCFIDPALREVKEPEAETLGITTLTGLVNYIQSEFDGDDSVIVQVVSPTQVRVLSRMKKDKSRDLFVSVKAIVPDFQFGQFYDTEAFNIKMQSLFLKNNDRDIILQVVGSIKEENVRTVGDDGVSQSVVARAGVGNAKNILVPNPVSLAPYRTFLEVQQPESEFIFRMKDGPYAAIFEADGGAWKNTAIRRIEEYLLRELDRDIKNGRIHVIA
ncbi:hypothetical protein [Listeria booriae]|uniref:Phage protein n=1 Tax=Listeria booriae TaxID=1552123 RepID=A0A842GAB3_9LIST|nr:hypothetical protein [Listeria booriae]MBC2100605.1 hypothetical protein [Listeria booriae]MBC2196842.1 hypothetical protein [Listeria booriae]MBC2293730.1 hypothetical protein [Listeria booriae]